MSHESDSTAAAPDAESGSSEPCESLQSVAELSLLAAVHGLLQLMGEIAEHLLVISQQNAVLIDAALSKDQEEDKPQTYLDGSPIR